MSHYRPNVRDLEFTLFEFLDRGSVLGQGPYADLDVDVATEMLREVARLAVEELAPSLLDSDRNPPVFDPATHRALLPESFKRSYRAWLDSEFWRTDVPEECGGTPVPPSLRWAIAELVLGSNPAVHLYSSGFSFAAILHRLGTPQQQQLAVWMVEKQWGATMVLTEPDAGSDVGAGRTRAVRQPDGTWHLHGVKRFITSGSADLYDNCVHLVLARPEGAGPGTKGLSLFVVPETLVDLETGELGARNGVFATAVEHKMGLKVSTTCELRFGEVDGIPAVGTLVGDMHDGIRQMFQVIEMARMMVGTKAIATLSTGYLNALDYARTRVQGPDLTRMNDKTSPRVPITRHPDVRRSLLLQKSYAEGLRALVLYTACQQDAARLAAARGETDELAARLNDLLLPLVKGCGSERSWVLLGSECLQTFGGSGFLQDYPLEQYVRDAKIDTLYEGTTAIQGMDFFFRKIVRDKGVALQHLSAQIAEFVKGDPGDGRLAAERALLGTALDDVQGIVGVMVSAVIRAEQGAATAASSEEAALAARSVYVAGYNTTRLLLAAGDLVCGWLLLRQAEVALDRTESGTTVDGEPLPASELAFYRGKVAGARYFARQVLPKLSAERVLAESLADGYAEELSELEDAAF